MKKKLVAVVLAGVLISGLYWGYSRYYVRERPSGLQATGTIEATQVELSARLPGTLQGLTIRAGEPVKKDQLVGVIVRNDLSAQRERDALGVLKAKAQLNDLVSGAREQEIRDAEIGVSTAQTNYDKAEKDYNRALTLFQEETLPASELEKLELVLKQSQNQLESSRSRLSLLQAGSRPGQVEAARAELERSAAILKASEALLEDTKIVSPIDGVVLSKNFEPGEYLPAGASVATVADLNDMWIKVYVATDDLPKIRLGQQVTFTVSGGAGEYRGSVEEIATRGEFTPKTIQTKQERTNTVFAVKIRIRSENGALKPGMPADVTLG